MSPIYDSISKEGYNSPYTAEELRQAGKDKIIDGKVMALGGITPENILEVKDFGFGGAVVLGTCGVNSMPVPTEIIWQ